MRNQEKVVIRSILEIRNNSRNFELIDKKGTLLEKLKKQDDKFNKVSISEDRVEVATDTLNQSCFFSSLNNGLILEAYEDLNLFEKEINNFFNYKDVFEFVGEVEVQRIGVRTQLFLHRKGMGNYEKIKQSYIDNFFSKKDELEEQSGTKISDTLFNLDLDLSEAKAHLSFAPITRQELLQRIFNTRPGLYKDKITDYGKYFEIDVYRENLSLKELEEIKEIALENNKALLNVYQNIRKMVG